MLCFLSPLRGLFSARLRLSNLHLFAEWALFHNVADLSIAYKIFGPRVGFFPMVNIKD